MKHKKMENQIEDMTDLDAPINESVPSEEPLDEGVIKTENKYDPLNEKRINYFKDKYLLNYIEEIESELRMQSSRIDRAEILGYILENLARKKIENVSVTNGNYRLEMAMGSPNKIAGKFLTDKRRFYRKIEIDEEIIKRKIELKEYLSTLNRRGKIKFYFSKTKNIFDMKNKKLIYDRRTADKITQSIYYLHLLFFIYVISVGISTYNILIKLLSGDYMSLYQLRYRSIYPPWNPGLFSIFEFFTLIFYLVTTQIFKNKYISLNSKSYKWSKHIKIIYFVHLIKLIGVSVFILIGSAYTLNYSPANYYNLDEIKIIISWALSFNIIIIVLLKRRMKIKATNIITGDIERGKTSLLISRISTKIMYRPLQFSFYGINLYAIGTAFSALVGIRDYLLYNMVYRQYISRNTNYIFIFFTGIIIILYFILSKITFDDMIKLILKKRVKRQIIIQMVCIAIYNVYMMLILYFRIKESEYVPFSPRQALFSISIYFGISIIILLINMKINNPKIVSIYENDNPSSSINKKELIN